MKQIKKANIQTIICTGDSLRYARHFAITIKHMVVPPEHLNCDTMTCQYDNQQCIEGTTFLKKYNQFIKTYSWIYDCYINAGDEDEQNDILLQKKRLMNRFTKFLENIKVIARCTPEHKVLLAETLTQFKYKTCFLGDSIGDCFAMDQVQVGMTMKGSATDMAKKKSDLILESDFRLILDTIKFGRNVYENIRKFLQYQAGLSINIVLYILIGSVLYKDFPIQPVVILFLNFIQDTFSSLMLSSELPSSNILRYTRPYDVSKSKSIFTNYMTFNVITCTIYQQCILYCMFYNGSIWF